MLKGKDHQNLDMVFRFVAVLVNRVLGIDRIAPMTKVNTKYTKLSNMLS